MNYPKLLKTSFVPVLCLGLAVTVANVVFSQDSTVTYADSASPVYYNSDITPDEAYRQLVAGNARYLKEDSAAARTLPRLSSDPQRFPIATVVYSADMPVGPTTLTQTSDHDLYLSSVESGVVSTEDLTALEYGLINLQTPLLVVMGHYPSRTVSTLIREYDALEARAQAEVDKITASGMTSSKATSAQMKLYNLVGPAVARSREAYPDLQGYDLANVVSEALVWQSLETILMKSTVAQDLIRAGRLNVIAAIVDDKTGKIYWLGAHPLQEEFLKPVPENIQNEAEPTEILTESALPAALDDTTIQEYVTTYENDPYYENIVTEYYTQPVYYQPSWELFSSRAWTYRPWYGVWYDPFVPWPYWSPWGVQYGEPGLGVAFWDGRLGFFVGFNRNYGVPVYYDPNYRPRDPWWGTDYFAHIDRHRHDVVFDLIIGGRRGELPPPPPRPWGPAPHDPMGYRPGAARPGLVVGLGGISIGIAGNPRRPERDPGRPGGPVGPKMPGGPFGPAGPGRPDTPVFPGRGTDRPTPGARPNGPRDIMGPGNRPGAGSPAPAGNRPGAGSPAPAGNRPGPGTPAPAGNRPGPGSPAPAVNRPGPGSPAPAGNRPGAGSPAPAGNRPGAGTPAPAGNRPGAGSPAPGGSRPGAGTPAPAGNRPGPGSPAPAGNRPGPGSPAPAGNRPGPGSPAPAGNRPGGAPSGLRGRGPGNAVGLNRNNAPSSPETSFASVDRGTRALAMEASRGIPESRNGNQFRALKPEIPSSDVSNRSITQSVGVRSGNTASSRPRGMDSRPSLETRPSNGRPGLDSQAANNRPDSSMIRAKNAPRPEPGKRGLPDHAPRSFERGANPHP